jgi:AcrR family transcriptional regulator
MPQVVAARRKVPKQARARATVEEILLAARRVLVEEGYEGASTNRIAQVAGVSVGSLYQYFPSKEAIVEALVEAHLSEIMTVVSRGLAEVATAPLDEAARRLVAIMIDVHRVEPELHRVLDARRSRIESNDHVRTVNQTIRLLVRAYLAERRHELRSDLDLDLATFLINELVETAAHKAVIEEPEMMANPRLVDEIATMVVRYVTPAR